MADLIYFGRLGDVTGKMSERASLPEDVMTVMALRSWMESRYENTGAFQDRTVRIAVNNAIVPETFKLSDGDEIAFMPPVGGG